MGRPMEKVGAKLTLEEGAEVTGLVIDCFYK